MVEKRAGVRKALTALVVVLCIATVAVAAWRETLVVDTLQMDSLVSKDGATTIISPGGAIDGEQITDDTIDDDSIDFSDVTGADLTLTDCTAVTASGAVYGGTVGFSAATGYFAVQNTTQLVFIASSGAYTNTLDADITTP